MGSRHYLSAPVRPISELVAMVNLDMIGRPVFLDRERFRVAKRLVGIGDGPAVGLLGDTPRTLEIARAACRVERLPAYRPADFPFLKRYLRRRTGGRDDSAPFRALGLPTVFFSTSEHDDYHQPTDTFDTVDPKMVRRIAAAAWRTILAIDALDDPSILRVAEKAQDGNESRNETENGGR